MWYSVLVGTSPSRPPAHHPANAQAYGNALISYRNLSIYVSIYLSVYVCGLMLLVAPLHAPAPQWKPIDLYVCVCVCVLRLECVCPAVLSGKVGFGAQILTTRRKNFTWPKQSVRSLCVVRLLACVGLFACLLACLCVRVFYLTPCLGANSTKRIHAQMFFHKLAGFALQNNVPLEERWLAFFKIKNSMTLPMSSYNGQDHL